MIQSSDRTGRSHPEHITSVGIAARSPISGASVAVLYGQPARKMV